MASPTNLAMGAGMVAVAGTWAQGKGISPRMIVGGTFLVITLALVAEASPELASAYALLILITALFVYGPTILEKTGVTK